MTKSAIYNESTKRKYDVKIDNIGPFHSMSITDIETLSKWSVNVYPDGRWTVNGCKVIFDREVKNLYPKAFNVIQGLIDTCFVFV